MSYTVVDAADVPGEGPGGAVRFLRRRLGATAFGINQFDLPPGAAGLQHDEVETGQEEIYVVLRGSGVMRLAGDELELRPDRYVRVEPSVVRQPVAGPEGLSWVAIGCPPGGVYAPRGPF
jgi:mannose-6-phosphate isomerase-like protein (cupin superfamily)